MKSVNSCLMLTLFITIICAACLSGCANTDAKILSATESTAAASDNLSTSDSDDSLSPASSAQNTQEYWLDIDAYRDALSDTRVSLTDYRGQYESDAASLTDTEYENLDFSDCTFQTFPETNELSVLAITEPEVTAQEAWNLIEGWVSYADKEDELDLKTDVKVISERLGIKDNGDYYSLYDNLKTLGTLEYGEGAAISTDTAFLQYVGGGINTMSTGEISSYLKNGSKASGDAFGDNASDTVKTGTPEEMADEIYPLIDGTLSVKDGESQIEDFYDSGILFPAWADGVSNMFRSVTVFRLGDVYGYDYSASRTYNGLPFVWKAKTMNYFYGGSYYVSIDETHIYLADSTGIAACYSNYVGSDEMTALLSETDLIRISDIADLLSQTFAGQINASIQTAELVYVQIEEPDTEHEIKYALPCWHFSGTSLRSGEDMEIFADALTGALVSCYGSHD
ncbi:MAG: hypothetical protein LUD14_12880 [Clostridiales bacterium]|nr:hypothetical protein [Clostridiales bacterium]